MITAKQEFPDLFKNDFQDILSTEECVIDALVTYNQTMISESSLEQSSTVLPTPKVPKS